MAHDIATVKGSAAFASRRLAAWHGLGKVVEHAPDSASMMRLAGLDWDVHSAPLFATHKGGAADGAEVKTDYRATYRLEGEKAVHLGTVKGRYHVVQNRDAFAFLDSMAMDGILRYETAGALGKGERVFMSALIPSKDSVVADSAIERYMLLFNSHDGSSGLEVMPTTVRVVCANTLRLARCGNAEKLTFRHTAKIEERMEQAKILMDAMNGEFDAWIAVARELTGKKVSDADISAILDKVYPAVKADASECVKSRRAEKVDRFWKVYRNEPTQQNIKGSAWGVLNAFTFAEDHGEFMSKGGEERKAEARFERVMEGAGNDAKIQAWNLLTV